MMKERKLLNPPSSTRMYVNKNVAVVSKKIMFQTPKLLLITFVTVFIDAILLMSRISGLALILSFDLFSTLIN